MFTALLIINLTALAGLTVMTWSPKYGVMRGSAVNPLIIFVVISLFFNIDFVLLHGREEIDIFERGFPVTTVDTLLGYVHYTVLFLAAAVGLIVAQLTAPFEPARVRSDEPTARDRLISATLFAAIIAIGLVGAVQILQSLSAILAGKLTRQVFFQSNRLALVAYSIICPGLAIFLSARNPTKPTSIMAMVGAVLILAITGSRGIVILVGLIYTIGLAVRGRRIPAYIYVFAIPVLIYLLAFSRFILRESWKFRTFAEFVEFRGGFGELFFNSVEVAMAEAITVIANNLEIVSRPPFESFLGVVMYPLPRSIFTFKPLGASSFITATLSPNKWYMTKAEVLTTGYGDFIMQFGLWGAVPMIGLLTFVWLRACLRAIHGSREQTAIWLPFLIWWLTIFMRGSLFNVGSSLWPFLVVLGTYTVMRCINFDTADITAAGIAGSVSQSSITNSQ